MMPHPGPKAGNLDRRAGDAIDDQAPAFARLRIDDVIALARAYRCAADPVIRQQLAQLVTLERTSVWNTQRARAAADKGVPSGLASLGKVAGGRITRLSVKLANEIVGARRHRPGTRRATGRRYRRGHAIVARRQYRRWHRRGPEERHRRADPWPASGASR